ncbi:uveal autoantigen with coiled-coil domains and ankyrin repeats protein [Teleopsis dalmanni]|uniref:uveal autoantigen with coiled-coil domains and ankyrin repeats protein n=1 Tax=Teleopsis dalmanni TaxID=139649 RepID=UPI0018CED4D3|nr:uveal autoantigen with coiled-coil domains and ankyrin repeats protein [Teleopsis dalmanni]XP_037946695.1 uveal autoantigen with coiled-coil domains and ankyrin repeats protein [Teleopsis dalmanni]XP_037946696.1 uveal autoantigen with coiled-coil domains and ankyrin repeats protein [Teleopsis dalmanni]
MNLQELERSNFERVLEWSQFFDKYSKVRDSEEILLENLEDHIDQDVTGEFEEAEEEPEENLQDIANLSGSSCNNTIANINRFIALNPNLPLEPINRKVGNGSYDIDSDDDDIQKLLNETVPIVIEHKRRLKESGIDRILDTFDAQKIEKELDKWLLRNHNANNSLINKTDDLKYTAPYTTGFNDHKFNESYESDEDSMHSVDTARYILSNQKRHGGKKQKFGSMCTTTTTIKTYCLLKSKRDALNRKYKTYPEHYEDHIKDILDRRCLSQIRTKRSDSKQFGVCAESHNIIKRRKYLRKRLTDHHNSMHTDSTDSSSSDGEINGKYFTYKELTNRKRSIKRQKTSRKRNFNCCCLYRCRCGRQCNLSATNSSYLSSHSFENKHRGHKKPNSELELDPRPCIRESECDCVNDGKLCKAIRHLADTSTERWLVDNNETPLKRSQPSNVTANLLKRLGTPKQSSACEISQKLKIEDVHKNIENLSATTGIQDKLTNRFSVEKTLSNHLGLNGRLLKSETNQRRCSSDLDEDCVIVDSFELNKQDIAQSTQQNTLSMDKKNISKQNLTESNIKAKKNLTKIENNVKINEVKKSEKDDLTLHGKNILYPDSVANSTTKKTKDLGEKKNKSKKEKVKNDKINSLSVDINQQLGNGQKLSTNPILDKHKSRNSKDIAIKKLSKNYDLLKKNLKTKKYKLKKEMAIKALDIIKQDSHKDNKYESEEHKTDTVQVISPKGETQKPDLKTKTKEELRIESVRDFVHDDSDKEDKFNKIREESSKKLKIPTKKQVQLQNRTESDESNFESDLKLAIYLSKQQFVKASEKQKPNDVKDIENETKAAKANKKQKSNDIKNIENKTKAEKANKKQKPNDVKDIKNEIKSEKANNKQKPNDVKDIENETKAKKVNKKLYFNDVKVIENKNNEGTQPEIKQKSVPIRTKLVSSTLPDDTFFQNSSSVCNSTAVANNIATDRQIPTHIESTLNNQTLYSSQSECDCTVVTSTTNDLQNLQQSLDLDIGQQTKKGIIIYTPTKKTSAPAHSFSDGCFNITQDHLSNVIGERSASKFLKYYLGPRRFDANATVYYKPPMSPIMDEATDSSADDLEYVGLFGDLHVSLSKNTE